MQETDRLSGKSRPRWLVSNGSAVVGPVSTELLLRGFEAGRVPPGCWIRDQEWSSWREAHQIREVSHWCRSQVQDTEDFSPDRMLELARDPEEVIAFALDAATEAVGAQAALAHRVREPLKLPVTSIVRGISPEDALGQVIWQYDAAYATARCGRIVLGRRGESSATRAVAARFHRPDHQPTAVAMFPVLQGDGVLAMIELSRTDHAFRTSDAKVLTRIAFTAAAQLAG